MNESLITFLHSGDLGDLVASLAVVKELCEKENSKALFYIDTTGGLHSGTDEVNHVVQIQTQGQGLKLNHSGYEFLKPLVQAQSYVSRVLEWDAAWKPMSGEFVQYNLNRFRLGFLDMEVLKETGQNLLFMHQKAVGLELGYRGPWLEVPDSDTESTETIVCRTSRYQSSHQLYQGYRPMIESGGFIGTDFEYDLFQDAFRYRPKRIQVEDALEAAIQIKKSKNFISNGTLFYWIAVGLGHPGIIHELGVDIPTTFFPDQNPPITYVHGLHILK